MDGPPYLEALIGSFLASLRRWPFLDWLLTRIAGRFTTWPADDFARFTNTPIGQHSTTLTGGAQPPSYEPARPPAPESIAPGAFEMRFAKLQQERRFEEMWAMLAEDAQRSWGGQESFVDRMGRQSGAVELLTAEVGRVDIVPEWTDRHRNRTYHNVARLAVRYRVKHDWREMTVDRQVHLVPAADGWRTLCYPQAG